MKTLKPKKKNDASHCGPAISAHGIFEIQATLKREKTETEKDPKALKGLKSKYALHSQPFLCLNPQNNNLKKTP